MQKRLILCLMSPGIQLEIQIDMNISMQIPTKQQLRVLKIVFDGEIASHEIPGFRGAMAGKVGFKHILFHNHIGDNFRYAYPLIQYKRVYGHPAIVCLGAGVEEIHHFFTKKDWSLQISGRTLDMKVDRLDLNQFTMQVWDKWHSYKLHNWIGLNAKTFPAFQLIRSDEERKEFLEKKLVGNILSFAKGIDWHIDKQIQLEIQDIGPSRFVKVKGKKILAFSPTFRTNVFLPTYIGLGAKVSLGYGVVHKINKSLNHNT